MSRNPEFLELLEKMKITHEKKSADYSVDTNVFSNFEYAAQLASVFTDEVDRVFATLVSVKLARICELRKGKVPNNESIEDSFLDLSNYCAIWGSRVMKLSKSTPKHTIFTMAEPLCTCGHLQAMHSRDIRVSETFGGCRQKIGNSECGCLRFQFTDMNPLIPEIAKSPSENELLGALQNQQNNKPPLCASCTHSRNWHEASGNGTQEFPYKYDRCTNACHCKHFVYGHKTENLDEACGRCGHKNAHHIDLTKEVLTYVPCKYIIFNGSCGCQ